MNISDINGAAKKHRRRQRVGRGEASGYGKTAGRGQKGLGQRSGAKSVIKLEGGQMQVFRTAPKRGFSNARYRKDYAVLNVRQLEEVFDAGSVVDPEAIRARGLSKDIRRVKILGAGELSKALTVKVHAISKAAREKVEKAGGTVELLPVGRASKSTSAASESKAE